VDRFEAQNATQVSNAGTVPSDRASNEPMSPFQLELARHGDAPRIATMSRRLVEQGLEPSWPRERIEWHLRHSESLVLAARARRELIGFAVMQYGDDAAHLNLLAVEPGFRRRAVGRQLLAWLEETALVAGTFVVRLELRAGNHGAHAFYEAVGYRDCERIHGYYQGREDAIQMSRDLRVAAGTPRAPLG
jgi:ribosomal protein S18 acetylase RimI-like enzyme